MARDWFQGAGEEQGLKTIEQHIRPRPAGIEPAVVRVAGSHRQMGRQQGEQLRDACARATRAAAEREGMRQLVSPLLPQALASWMIRRRAAAALAAELERYGVRHDERIDGLADGAAIDRSWLDLANGLETLAGSPAEIAAGSTTVAVGEGRAGNGGALLARNLDLPPGWPEYLAVRFSQPDLGLASLEITLAPLAGSLIGINEMGLAISYHPVRVQEKGGSRLPISMLVQDALERCATSHEAVEFLSSCARGGGGIVTLLDGAGDVRVVEISPGHVAVRANRSGLAVAAEHFCDESMVSRGISHSERHGGEPGKRAPRVLEPSEKRQQRACEQLEEESEIGELRLAAVMEDHGGRAGGEHSICRHGRLASTACSVLLYPARREARIASGPPCETERSYFSL